ncbi:unnamed protein product [Closterium sp. NIES-65]|nr:unnamed protein product [Closterium sp. NIES-65]
MEVVAESPCPYTAAADVGLRARAPQLRQRAPAEAPAAGSEPRPARPGAGRRAANATRSRQYLARWTPEEDAILLEHVMAHGTAEWGQLRASGRLPLRDNKACCNRFLLLKRKFLQLDDHQQQEPHYQPHYEQPRQQHDTSPWPRRQHDAHPANLPCCLQPADTALHLMATAPHAYPQAAQARQHSAARHSGWKGEWRGSLEGVAWWEGVVDPRLGSTLTVAHAWDGAVACGRVSESVCTKSAWVQGNAVRLQQQTAVVKQQQQQIHAGGVWACVEQAVKASASAAPSACCAVLQPPSASPALPTASSRLSHCPLGLLHPDAPLMLPSSPPSSHSAPAADAVAAATATAAADPCPPQLQLPTPLSASSSLPCLLPALPPLHPLPLPLSRPDSHLHAPQPLAALRGTTAAPAAAGAAIDACVRAGPSDGQSQADMDRWVLEQVGLMVGGQEGTAPGGGTLLADVRGGGGVGVGGGLGEMEIAAGDGGGMVGHGGKRTRVSGGGKWDEQHGEACMWEGPGSHCGGRKRVEQEGEPAMLSQEDGHWQAVASDESRAHNLDDTRVLKSQLLTVLQSALSGDEIDSFMNQYGDVLSE